MTAQGAFSTDGHLQIRGRLAGRIDSARQVTVAAQASFHGPLAAESLHVVSGASVEAELKIGPLVRPAQNTSAPAPKLFASK